MNLVITLVQLSDLHQSTASSLHTSLLSSILSDIENQKTEGKITDVDALLICGDFIEGSPLDDGYTSGIRKIRTQYAKSKIFLDKLCDELFDGEKQKIIIVPGNHDISWQHSNKSMNKIDSYDKKYKNLVNKPGTNIRWNWNDGSFYHIDDLTVYRNRFHHFSKFFKNYYGDRVYSLDPKKQYSLFEYPDLNLLIAGFNSCYNNDHLNHLGWINSDCIDDCYLTISKGKYRNWTKIAVWHHGFRGNPGSFDFLSNEIIQLLINRGFIIGFHGHEHRAEKHHIETDNSLLKSMVILGCGTVCAPQKHIPAGNSNEYNIINLDIDFKEIRYYVRTKITQNDIFIWDHKKEATIKPYIQLSLFEQINTDGAELGEVDIYSELAFAQSMIANHEYDRALIFLAKLDQTNPFVKTLKLQCHVQLEQNEEIIKMIPEPSSIDEYAILTDALWKEKEMEKIKSINTSPTLNEIIKGSSVYQRICKKIQDRDEHGKN